MKRRRVSIFKVIGRQLTGLRPWAISARRNLSGGMSDEYSYTSARIKHRWLIVDHRGYESRNDETTDDKSVSIDTCAYACVYAYVDSSISSHG